MVPSLALGAELTATTATLPSVFSSAQGGDTIALAPGSYGTFSGAAKSGVVTIKGGNSAVMSLSFSSASNIAIDGLRLNTIEMAGATKNITVRNSTIVGQTTFRTSQLQHSNILFDGNVHGPYNASGGAEGRIFMPGNTSQPSGITIQNSRFGPGGNSDGIQNGSNGTRILNNEFIQIYQVDGGSGVHADSIQLYGSKNTIIRGNYFNRGSVGIMCPDGCEHETVEDNVFKIDASPFAITWFRDLVRSPVAR